MNAVSNKRLPQVTRWFVYAVMGLVAAAGIFLSLGAVVMPFFWDDAVADMAKNYPSLDTSALPTRLYVVFAFGIVTLGIIWTILRKLLAIINSVEEGDPFVVENALRLRAIAWMMVAAQLVAIPLAIAARHTANLFGANDVNYEFPVNGILAILLVFILADIFRRGAEMREELEGTV